MHEELEDLLNLTEQPKGMTLSGWLTVALTLSSNFYKLVRNLVGCQKLFLDAITYLNDKYTYHVIYTDLNAMKHIYRLKLTFILIIFVIKK